MNHDPGESSYHGSNANDTKEWNADRADGSMMRGKKEYHSLISLATDGRGRGIPSPETETRVETHVDRPGGSNGATEHAEAAERSDVRWTTDIPRYLSLMKILGQMSGRLRGNALIWKACGELWGGS